jgi:hypothetical protein
MDRTSLARLSDRDLLQRLTTVLAQDRATTAELLAILAEVDARKLYLPMAYPSMYAYCVGKLGLCEQAAFRRIRAARAARRFPALLPALADGRLTLSAVLLLSTHLTRENCATLIAEATRKNRLELERMLAERFPRQDVATQVVPLVPIDAATALGLTMSSVSPATSSACQLSPATVVFDERGIPEPSPPPAATPPRPRITPLAPERYALQVTVSQPTYEKLQHARALLGHAVPTGDLAEVLDRALDSLIAKLERRKCAATSKPRATRPRRSRNVRYIPAPVRRAVWERDGGRCTFVSDTGHRCDERSRLEFDHIEPVARGGRSTLEGLRLRCRAHNQLEAERTFGSGFMEQKRRARRRAPDVATAPAPAPPASAIPPTPAPARAVPDPAIARSQEEIIPWLRQLGIGLREAREAAEMSTAPPYAPLEERVRQALRHFGAPNRRVTPALQRSA